VSRFPTELPSASADPWWQTVSIAELDAAAAVIDAFTRPVAELPPAARETFARAVALRMLCADAGTMDQAMERADATSERFRPELRPDGDPALQQGFGKWLNCAEAIARGLLRSTELLPEPLRADHGPALMAFLRRLEEHIDAHLEWVFHRRAVPFVPRSPRNPASR
jgi:hypothetical protein